MTAAGFLASLWTEIEASEGEVISADEATLDHLFMMHSPMAMRGTGGNKAPTPGTGRTEPYLRGAGHGATMGLAKPPAETDAALSRAVRGVAATATLDLSVPTASKVPGGARAKATLSRAMSWYVGYIGAQVARFAAATAEATSVIAGRLGAVESSLEGLVGRNEQDPAMVPLPTDPHWWGEQVAGILQNTGRVLHLGCGDGWLVRMLMSGGVDAYGADARVPTGWRGPVEIDLRSEGAFEHLGAVGPGSLDGVVVSASTVILPPEGYRELVELIGNRLATDAVWVVYSPTPEAWFGPDGGIASDLLPGRPLKAITWRHLMEAEGFTCDEQVGEADYLVVGRRGKAPA